MKKFFTFIAAVLFAGSMMAKESVDFSAQGYENAQAIESYAGTDFSIAFSKGTNNNAPKYYTSGEAIRCYGGNTFTVSSEKDITAIVLKFGSSDGTNTIATDVEKFETDTWTGTAKAIKFTIEGTTGNRRLAGVRVFFEGEPITDDPEPEVTKVTVAEAITAGMALDSAKTSEDRYEVTGFVVKAQKYNTTYKNQIWFMVDDTTAAAAETEFEAYACTVSENKEVLQVINGDKVALTGKLTKYWDKDNSKFIIEISGGTAVFIEKAEGDHSLPVVKVDTVSVDSALVIGKALDSGKATTDEYVITGYVSNIYTFFSQDFKNETFWITSDPESRAASSADGAFEVYRGKPSTEAGVGLGAKISIKCKIKNYNGTIENDGSNLAVTVLEPSTFVPDTITVAEAIEIASTLEADKKTPTYCIVKGFVNEVTSKYSSKNNDASFTLSDLPSDPSASFAAYRASILKADSSKVNVAGAVKEKLYVQVMGYLTKHGEQLQIAQGAAVKFVDAPEIDTLEVSVTEAVAIAQALPDNASTPNFYKVTGFVVKPQEMEDEDEDTQNFYLAAEAGGESAIYAWKAQIAYPGVAAGDKVALIGVLKKNVNEDKTTIQIVNGAVQIIERAQGIENIVLTEKAKKVVVDGVVYVVRDNKMFNVLGTQVR